MSKSTLNVRVDSQVKEEAKILYSELGMDMTTAINLFLKASIREQRFPIELKLDPFYSEENKERLKHSMAQAKNGQVAAHDLIDEDGQ